MEDKTDYEELQRQRLRDAAAQISSTDEGKIFLQWLMKDIYGLDSGTFTLDPLAMAYNEGMTRAGRLVINLLNETDRRIYPNLLLDWENQRITDEVNNGR